MPAGSPFTTLCRQLAELRAPTRADLHVHTTHSDGTYTPSEVVALAKKANLKAIAITDHDTVSAIAEAGRAAPPGLEVIPGVEISCEFRDRELHLLGYFFRPDDPPLNAALDRIRVHRAERFREMLDRCERHGMSLDFSADSQTSLGRRHVAVAMLEAGHVNTVAEAFARFLRDGGPIAVPKVLLPVGEAISLVRAAGGVTSWAHPPTTATPFEARQLRDLGLTALEAEYPFPKREYRRTLRALAEQVGLAVTGGSDCHGPAPAGRHVGGCGIDAAQLRRLRAQCR